MNDTKYSFSVLEMYVKMLSTRSDTNAWMGMGVIASTKHDFNQNVSASNLLSSVTRTAIKRFVEYDISPYPQMVHCWL